MKYDISLQTISWINQLNDNTSLEISPKFQRRAVWLDKERSSLLSTIYDNLPFPEIYMQVVTDLETGKPKYVVVDGQQRITSILKFINNEFPLLNSGEWKGQFFRDLSTPELRRAFWNYQVVIRNLYDTNDAEIRELFKRLNTNNFALNDQELRNAHYKGQFKKLAERLADNPVFQSSGLFTARDIRRMFDIEYAGELLVRIIFGVTNKKDLLDTAYLKYEEEFPGEAEVEKDFNVAVSLALSIFDKSVPAHFKTKGNFHSLFGVCYDYYKITGEAYFLKLINIRDAILDLLTKAKNDDFDADVPEIEEYAVVSGRSTSDKSRRVRREEILMGILSDIEGFKIQDPTQVPAV